MLAATYDVASVCVRPADVARARRILDGTDVAVGTTIGFPHGNHRTETKVFESVRAIGDGARELDMVIGIARSQVGPRRRRRGGYPGRRERRPRGSRDRQGHLRERLPDRRREDPRLPPHRSGRWRLRQDVHGVRAGPARPTTTCDLCVPTRPRPPRSRPPAASGRSTRCSRCWRSGSPGSARPRPRRSSTTSRPGRQATTPRRRERRARRDPASRRGLRCHEPEVGGRSNTGTGPGRLSTAARSRRSRPRVRTRSSGGSRRSARRRSHGGRRSSRSGSASPGCTTRSEGPPGS